MAKAGLTGNPPVVAIAPAPTDAKRQGDFWVNDIKSTIDRLNTQIAKAGSVGIAIELNVGTNKEGLAAVELVSATRS